MTIDDIRAQKAAVEKKMLEVIADFEKASGQQLQTVAMTRGEKGVLTGIKTVVVIQL